MFVPPWSRSGARQTLTVDLDVAGGHGFTHTVDGLAGVDAGVALPEAGDVQRHVTKVEGAAASRTWTGRGVSMGQTTLMTFKPFILNIHCSKMSNTVRGS